MGTRVLAESQQLVVQFLRPTTELIAALFTIIAIIALLLWVNPIVTMIAFGALGGIYGAVYTVTRPRLRQLGELRAKTNTERFRVANEALSGIKDIKLLGREKSYADRYASPSRRMAHSIVMVQVLSQVPQFVLQAVAFGGVIVLCLVLMEPQDLTSGVALGGIVPTLGVFAFAGQRLMPELSKFYQSLAQLQAGGAAVTMVHMDLINNAASGSLPSAIPSALGLNNCLELKQISYQYPSAQFSGVTDVSLKIQAGERIGIVGSTGAGKTTLVDLMLGLLSPSGGILQVDGIPINDGNLREWQQSVGYVPQDIFLIDASVSENIALGLPYTEIDHERVRHVAEIAKIDAFIRDSLPNSYETTIGERGVRISGGQRQRLGIAHSLYHDADLIIFDEATSALDNLTEAEVMASIAALPGEKTVIMIAHRLSTIKFCDQIVVMEGGRVIDCANWDVLTAKSPTFNSILHTGEKT